jgi:ribosomal protein L16 Arg81 hydroxylase
VEHERFPNCEKALESLNLIDQLPGEVIFVPSGWWHQVVNLDDALSVNHNWINGANIMCTWNFLKDERAKVFTSGTGMILPRAKR